MTPHRHFVLPFLLVAAAAARSEAESGVPPAGFPYKASLASNDVYVRSGPGTEYYPTDKLHSGDTVEVYRHDSGGWCAIRPPSGSFTWVSSRFVKQRDQHLGEITGSRVAARVGSLFSPRPRRRPGATGTRRTGRNTGGLQGRAVDQDRAPSGEFRWIHEKFLDRKPVESTLRRISQTPRIPRAATRFICPTIPLGRSPGIPTIAARSLHTIGSAPISKRRLRDRPPMRGPVPAPPRNSRRNWTI